MRFFILLKLEYTIYYRKRELLPYGQKLLFPLIPNIKPVSRRFKIIKWFILTFDLFTLLKEHHNDHMFAFPVSKYSDCNINNNYHYS